MVESRAKSRFGLCYLVIGGVLGVAALVVRPGVYRGSINGRLIFQADEDSIGVSLTAETQPEWRWIYPRNHRYERATMTITHHGERVVQVDLAGGAWTCGDEEGQLGAGGLVRLLTGRRSAAAMDPVLLQHAQSLLSTLQQMHAGEFLRPRRHSYGMDDTGWASLTHITREQNWGLFAVFGWLLAWPVVLVIFRRSLTSARLAPGTAFLVTGGIVAALDLIFIGVHALFSPGGISETMEFLIGLLNIPAMILLGGCSGPPWLDMAFSAVSWSVLVSLSTVFARPAQYHAAAPDSPAGDPPAWL